MLNILYCNQIGGQFVQRIWLRDQSQDQKGHLETEKDEKIGKNN